jgi:hypothetical protein
MPSSTPSEYEFENNVDYWAYEPPLAAAWTRWVTRAPTWLLFALALVLFVVPLILGMREGLFGPALESGEVRFWLLWPTLLVYTSAMIPLFVRADRKVLGSIRPLVELDDAEFERVLARVGRFNWQAEVMAFLAGVLLGLMVGDLREPFLEPAPLTWWLYLSGWTAFGILGWVVLTGMTCTRLTSAIYRQPMAIDLFDISAFEPIGRQSLNIALAIVGGTLISLVFLFDPAIIGRWQNLIIYSVLTVVTLVLFFVNMWPTHNLLARRRRAHVKRTEQRISDAYGRLDAFAPDVAPADDDIVALSAELNALIAAERRLKLTRTWPYDTETLRTLAISVLMPLFVGLSRLLAAWFTSAPPR